MKIKKILLSFVLVFVCAISMFSLVGCDDVSLNTLKENFDALDKTYQNYSTVFVVGDFDDLSETYVVNYGDKVNAWVDQGKEGFVDLKSLYNSVFAISNDFIKNNKTFVLNLKESNLTKGQKKALKGLNSKVKKYMDSIEDFVDARADMIEFFEWFGDSADAKTTEIKLREFTKAYGAFLERNIEVSTSLANVIEEVDIFNLMEKTEPIANDSLMIKEYVRAKLLPVFSRFMIEEIANNLNWKATTSTPAKIRISKVLNNFKAQYVEFKNGFVLKDNSAIKVLQKSQMATLLDQIDAFFAESEAYFQAVDGLNVTKLAQLKYDNDLNKYKKSNKLAEVYLSKIEQYVGDVLPKFINSTIATLYA